MSRPRSAVPVEQRSKFLKPEKFGKRLGSKLILLALSIAVATLLADAVSQNRIIEGARKLTLADKEIGSSQIPRGAVLRETVIPTFGIDGNWWILHAEDMVKNGDFRVRKTNLDNAPEGREVHWSSGILWYLALVGQSICALTGMPLQEAVPLAAFFWGPFAGVLFLLCWGLVIKKWLGGLTASLSVLALCSTPGIFELFRFGICDHHGMVGGFAAAGTLALAWGILAPISKSKKQGASQNFHLFMWSGFWLGCAMWVSAATALPVIAAAGAGGFIYVMLGRDLTLLPLGCFRVWGLAGCLTSLAFYFIEYFPAHMGWRLEVNHPLYAFAWLAGGEVLETLRSAREGHARFATLTSLRLLSCLCVVGLPILLILAWSERVFWVADPFLLNLHKKHIMEFQPFYVLLAGDHPILRIFSTFLWPTAVLAVFGYAVAWKENPRRILRALFCVSLPAIGMFMLAMTQVRWTGIALMQWVMLATILFGLLNRQYLHIAMPKPLRFVAYPVLAAGLLIHPFFVAMSVTLGIAAPSLLPKELAPVIVARDIIQRILVSSPQVLPRVLCAPTTSTELVAYSRAEVLGTLYWENMPGLKAAANIFASPSEEEAREQIKNRGITHILLFSWDEFVKEYTSLLREEEGMATQHATTSPKNATSQGGEATNQPDPFLQTLLSTDANPPQWLRPLYYPIPESFDMREHHVWLYQVVPNQTLAEANLHRGIFAHDSGDFDAAISFFEASGKLDPLDDRIPRLIEYCQEQKSLAKPPGEATPMALESPNPKSTNPTPNP